MKKFLIVLTVVAMSAFLLVGCNLGTTNTAPVITTTALPDATVGTAYTTTVVATDADNDALTFSLVSELTGMVISEAGVISGWTPAEAGTKAVTVAVTDGKDSVSADFTITVNVAEVAVTGVTLDKTTLALTVEGATGILVETVLPADAADLSVTWTSSDEAVATVAGGVVTPLTIGTANITVTTEDGDFTATCEVTVRELEIGLTKIVVDPETMDLMAGDSEAIKSVTATYEIKGSVVPIALGDCTFASDDETIATVSGAGLVTAVAEGIATITVSYGGKTDTCAVTVTAVADLTLYEAALAAVTEANYTAASWTAYQLVVAANVVTDQNTQAIVDAATTAITTAQGDLVLLADLTAYEAALAAVTEANYTAASWTIYQAVVTANEVTDQNTQADVNTATLAIIAAQGDLVAVADLTAYNTALAAVTEADYTIASWTIYQAAVDANVVTIEDTQVDVDAATLAITTAQGALVEIADLTAYNTALAAVTEADYTIASWTIYQAAVDANVVTIEDTQVDVDAATAAIIAAQGDLVVAPVVIDIAAIPGVIAPVTGGTPVTVITPTAQYTGTVAWSPTDSPFVAEERYTATITLAAKTGYTLEGVDVNFFKVDGATIVTNAADSGVVIAVFPTTL